MGCKESYHPDSFYENVLVSCALLNPALLITRPSDQNSLYRPGLAGLGFILSDFFTLREPVVIVSFEQQKRVEVHFDGFFQ